MLFCLGLWLASFVQASEISSPANIDKVLAYLQSHPQVRTIDELLAALPDEFLANYTLLYNSNSLQSATPTRPRAIVYGPDGRFVIAFNGDKTQSRFSSLETIQFRDEGAKFEFREIDFPEDGRASTVQVSPVNPPLCLQCHYSDPRPNWEHYSEWPGAYGTTDDRIGANEKDTLAAFLQSAGGLPRYRQLRDLAAGYQPAFGGRTQVEHNIVMLHRLSQLNFKRIARSFRQTKQYSLIKYLLVGTIWCRNFENYFPADASPPVERLKAALAEPHNAQVGGDTMALAQALGLDSRSLYMDFLAPGGLSLITPLSPPQMMTMPILEDEELKPFFDIKPSILYGEQGFRANPKGEQCAVWEEKTRQLLREW